MFINTCLISELFSCHYMHLVKRKNRIKEAESLIKIDTYYYLAYLFIFFCVSLLTTRFIFRLIFPTLTTRKFLIYFYYIYRQFNLLIYIYLSVYQQKKNLQQI